MSKFYVVWKGVKPGIYRTWDECYVQVYKFKGAKFKAFLNQQEAEHAFNHYLLPETDKPDLTNIAVDAGCIGNPGIVEYRIVDISTRVELFRKRPIPLGTNNLGEFLAIVHGLALLYNNKEDARNIYSDSATAIKWVREKEICSTLPRTEQTKEIYNLTDRAITWLKTHTYSTKVLKWDTWRWGEIPADFGRK